MSTKHNDVIKWKHFPRYWPFMRGIHRSPVNSPHKGQWRRALMFSLICVWINGWVNNGEAGDLRRYRAHYDVIVMVWLCCFVMGISITIHCDFIHSVQHEIHCVTLCITMQVALYTEYVWTHIWHVYCILINWLYQNALCILISPSVLCTQGSPFHMGWVMEVRLSTYSKTR